MIGLGIDSCSEERIKKSMEKEGFIKHCFSQKEIEQRNGARLRHESYAAAFAAKEAFGKAMGTGVSGFLLNEVQLLHEQSGKPYLALIGSAKEKLIEKNASAMVSITHENGLATAVVILY